MIPRRRAFAALLAGGVPVLDAAQAVGVSERTARRWTASADVRAAVRRAQDDTAARLAARLSLIASDAVEVIGAAVQAARPVQMPVGNRSDGRLFRQVSRNRFAEVEDGFPDLHKIGPPFEQLDQRPPQLGGKPRGDACIADVGRVAPDGRTRRRVSEQ